MIEPAFLAAQPCARPHAAGVVIICIIILLMGHKVSRPNNSVAVVYNAINGVFAYVPRRAPNGTLHQLTCGIHNTPRNIQRMYTYPNGVRK